MDDNKFEFFQRVRSEACSHVVSEKWNSTDIEEFCEMLRDDMLEEREADIDRRNDG